MIAMTGLAKRSRYRCTRTSCGFWKRRPGHDAVTLAATTSGTPWTVSGFNATFIKTIARLEQQGKVESGLAFHRLRHTCGTTLVEAGFHYTETADTSQRLAQMMDGFDPLGSRQRT